MDIYLGMALLLLLSSLLFANTRYLGLIEKLFLAIFLAGWCIIFAFRNETVGFDTINYVRIYDLAKYGYLNVNSDTSLEKGFVLIVWILGRVGANFCQFQFVICFISMLIVYKASAQYRLRTFLIYLMYTVGCFFNLMNQERSAFGSFICLLVLERISKGKKKHAILIMLLACTIHFGMIAFIPVVVISVLEIKLSKKLLTSYLIVAIASYTSVSVLIAILLRFFPKYNIYFTDKISYIKSGNTAYLLYFIAVIIFALYSRQKALSNGIFLNEMYDVLVWSSIFGATISLIVLKVSMAQRFMIPALFTTPFLIVEALQLDENWLTRLLKGTIIAVFFFCYMYIYLYISEAGMGRDGIVPYNWRFYG